MGRKMEAPGRPALPGGSRLLIRLSLIVSALSATMLSVMVGVTVLPRAKPDINADAESLPPVVYAPVMASEIQTDAQAVKLDNLEDRLRSIQRKVERIEGKVEGQ